MVMQVMSPRVVLGAPPSPLPPLPAELGGVPIWSEIAESSVGSSPAWEYRHPSVGRCLVLQSVASAGSSHVWIAWVPADARAGINQVFAQLAPGLVAAGLVSAWWDCDEADGTLRPRLDATSAADAVRAAWPSTWRVRTPGDAAESPPTGPLMIGEVIA